MKHSTKTIFRLLSATLSTLLCGGVVAPFTAFAANETKQLIVNDSETGTDLFQFEFHGKWVHEGGYPNRFEGGDEHWTTTAQFGSDYPGVTFRFAGNKIALYGHKVSEGAMARITLDGKDMGTIDLYNPTRVEKVLLYESGELPGGEHTITMQLIEEKNPAAGNTHEASIDYAVITTTEAVPATGVQASTKQVTLEEGMTYPLSYKLLPDYATEAPAILYTSSDESVVTVDQSGVLTAKGVGTATVTLAPADKAFSDTVTVTVRRPIGGTLIGMAGDTNIHTMPEDYYNLFDSLTGKESTQLTATAWLNDTASAKLDLLTTGKALTGVKATASELTNAHGDKLDGEVNLFFIKTVLAHDTGKYVPDVLYTSEAVDLPASSVSSVWVQIRTTANALPGIYTGEISITADGLDTPEVLTLSVEVIGLEKPETEVPFEIWQYPYSSNRYYSGKTTEEYFGNGAEGLWSIHLNPAYEAGLRSQLELYRSAGGNSITVTIVEDPWNSQTPDPYPSMIKWTQKKDGSFAFDYTDFDYYVELCASCGINGPIMAFSIAGWADRITYFSERSGQVTSENLTPGSDRYKKVWTAFLTDLMAHTKEKGWFDRVYMAMDERPANVVEAVLDVVESVKDEDGQCFKTALAVFTFDTEHLFDRITDLSLAIAMNPTRVDTIIAQRKRMGLTTTLYTCGAQFSALSNPPIESLFTMWFVAQRDADGFLRWALDAFNADPLNSSDHRLFAAGDIFLIYPDDRGTENPTAHSSARFEKLSEGVRDVAKLRWLLEHYPKYENSLSRVVNGISGGDLPNSVIKAQNKLNSVGREVAVAALIKAAEASEYASDKSLTAAVKAAREVLSANFTADDLTEAAYGIAKALRDLSTPSETQPCTEAPTDPVESVPVESVPTDPVESVPVESVPTDPVESVPVETVPTDSDTDVTHTDEPAKKGCSSAVGAMGVTATAVAAAVVLKKKKED